MLGEEKFKEVIKAKDDVENSDSLRAYQLFDRSVKILGLPYGNAASYAQFLKFRWIVGSKGSEFYKCLLCNNEWPKDAKHSEIFTTHLTAEFRGDFSEKNLIRAMELDKSHQPPEHLKKALEKKIQKLKGNKNNE